ncbi:hypothetical protein DASC09_038220 [Saccharomycopsis crataegensis]|uniref:Uncharacterized protein n=1 Tax=Saccharomycopsis crataegensis TaxID=43959 RepID=A0AAV5QPI4_9ASCO|nr:hypothetical protein DASC09_038220 [Saccharomycopsis crataegensis]
MVNNQLNHYTIVKLYLDEGTLRNQNFKKKLEDILRSRIGNWNSTHDNYHVSHTSLTKSNE